MHVDVKNIPLFFMEGMQYKKSINNEKKTKDVSEIMREVIFSKQATLKM